MSEYSVFHGLVGVFAVMIALAAGVPAVTTAGIVLTLGIAHEVYDGDFRKVNGGPYEGAKDALSFLFPGPFLYLLLTILKR